MNPEYYAKSNPNQPAVIMANSGETVSYKELNDRSNQLAKFFWDRGLRRGDHIAVILENHPRYFEVYWAAMRSGLYFTPVNWHLGIDEATYILNDCGAKALVTSCTVLQNKADLLLKNIESCPIRLMIDGAAEGYESYEDEVASLPAEPLSTQPRGRVMFYSSGTTGNPKGIWRPLPKENFNDPVPGFPFASLCPVDTESVYLSPAPLYHSAVLGFAGNMQEAGATVVVMEHFEPQDALNALEKYRVTHSQWVPTMFARMAKLPLEERTARDLSAHRAAFHGAAPCSPALKREMIDWWGSILIEYYGGSEASGVTLINSDDWLKHEGSVGKALLGEIHICAEGGEELPVGGEGLVYFGRTKSPFSYFKDEQKTRSAEHPEHSTWTTMGDIGRLDADGYLYLTDRQHAMIISGGVNIYPAEAESVLVMHPKVLDVAVIGVPNQEYGEEVKAVVQLVEGIEPSSELEEELIMYCRDRLAKFKCPRSVDFERELPRSPAGKLYKRFLKDRYWGDNPSNIIGN